MVICLELGADDLHMVQLMPLPPIISCFVKIHNGYALLVPAYPGCTGKEAVKWVLLLYNVLIDVYFMYQFVIYVLINVHSFAVAVCIAAGTSQQGTMNSCTFCLSISLSLLLSVL